MKNRSRAAKTARQLIKSGRMNKIAKSPFLTRTLSGIVFVIIVVGAVLLSYSSFVLLLAVICAGSMNEFYKMATIKGVQPQRLYGIVTGLLFLLAISLLRSSISFKCDIYAFYILVTIAALFFIAFIVELYRKKDNPIANIAVTLTGIFYVSVPLSMICLIASTKFPVCDYTPNIILLEDVASFNPGLILAYLFIVWANDVGAYLTGVAFGKRKLFERISPKKSWEGFFGGLLLALIVSVSCGFIISGNSEYVIFWAGLGAVITVSGVFGDLVESMFKRSASMKDSGSIMPGHGGFLDRFDALLMSAPFVFIYFTIFAS